MEQRKRWTWDLFNPSIKVKQIEGILCVFLFSRQWSASVGTLNWDMTKNKFVFFYNNHQHYSTKTQGSMIETNNIIWDLVVSIANSMANASHLRFPSGMVARLAVQRCIMPIVSVAPGAESCNCVKAERGGATKKRARNDLDLLLLGDFLADSIMVNHHYLWSLRW